MKTFARGQRSRLDALSSSLDLRVELRIEAPSAVVFDFCCFGVSADNVLEDDRYFVFYNQLASPKNEIVMQNTTNGAGEFEVHLAQLPPNVRRLVFAATIDGVGTMTQITRGHMSLGELNTTGPFVRYEFSGADFHTEQALLIGEIYWKDGWRFGAIGQGFAGDLSRLLAHFGGIEIKEENASGSASQSSTQSSTSHAGSSSSSSGTSAQATPPSLPHSPAISPVAPPAASQNTPSYPQGGALQKLIDDTPVGGILSLLRDEYEGPITISRPITIDGRGSVIWAHQGPVLRVLSTGVVLRDIDIEATIADAGSESDVALSSAEAPQLHNVGVRGRVVGVGEALGEWKLPPTLNLGEFAARSINQWHFEIEAPIGCELRSQISGLSLQPSRIEAGRQRVVIEVRDVARETLLLGKIEVREGEIVRPIAVSGRASRDESYAPVQDKALWSP